MFRYGILARAFKVRDMWSYRRAIFFLILAALSACADNQQSGKGRSTSVRDVIPFLDARLNDCTAIHNYNPNEAWGLGQYELAPTERAWLECAYTGVEKIIVPNTAFPKLYREAVTRHKSMTNLVERGELTRAERRKRTLEIRDSISQMEIERIFKEAKIYKSDDEKYQEMMEDTAVQMIRRMPFFVMRF